MCVIVDAGPAHLPLGLGPEPKLARYLPDNARIAIVTAGYACAHYDDYTDAIHQALQATNIEFAAVRLLLEPATTQTDLGLAGPALVLDAVTPARDTRQSETGVSEQTTAPEDDRLIKRRCTSRDNGPRRPPHGRQPPTTIHELAHPYDNFRKRQVTVDAPGPDVRGQ
jgi:hypothetical protein